MSRKNTKYPIGALLLLVLIAAAYTFFNFLDAGSNGYSTISRIEVKGNKFVSSQEIIEQLGVKKESTVKNSHLPELENRLEANQYITNAVVIISPPSKLIVHVKEFEPVALLTGKKHYFLGRDGKIYPFKFGIPLGTMPIFNHVNVSNDKILAKCLAITTALQRYPVLRSAISEIFFDHNQPQLVLKKNRIKVTLPSDNIHKNLFLLEEFYENNFDYIVSKKYKKIDFLYDNKIICS